MILKENLCFNFANHRKSNCFRDMRAGTLLTHVSNLKQT